MSNECGSAAVPARPPGGDGGGSGRCHNFLSPPVVAAAAAVIVEVVLSVSVAPAVVAPPVEIIPIPDDRREYGACKINS